MAVKVVKQGMRVMLNKQYIVGQRYNGRDFDRNNGEAQGKVFTVNAYSSPIFDTKEGYGVMHYEWIDELKDISLDNLITAVILGGLSEEEYEVIRRERG